MTDTGLAFLCGTALDAYDPSGPAAFHDSSPVLRHRYRQVADWTGVPAGRLLGGDHAGAGARERALLGRLAPATAMLGIHDVLAVHRIRPGVLGGLGVGAMVASSLAGALPREALIRTLADGGGPDEPEPAGAVALVFLPAGHDPEWYRDALRAGVRFGGSLGEDTGGTYRVVLLTGGGDALRRLAAEAPEGAVRINGSPGVTVHSPLGRAVHDRMRRLVTGLPFAAPVLPLCSPLEARTLRTADEVGDLFSRNVVQPADLGALTAEMHAHGTRLGLVLGPSLPRNLLRFPFPVVHVESPADVARAISAILEFGVEMSPAGPHRVPYRA
ncbi:ACP S-malonyltransferase [Streptomyces angustmyceticus]|uniref:ACP S-malonyltransferase n=1 Tax=Streptomyces angustmyceticus TaxID=285578 RepID=UPI0021AE47FE|nr:ACP S-malonyltransferase [Streptomyces angustmyceticus]